MNFTAERVRSMLFDAFLCGFLLEHDAKSWSRYPLAGASTARMRELLEPEFDAWLRSTPTLGTDEGRKVEAAPTTVPA